MAHKIKNLIDCDLLGYCFDNETIERSNRKNIKLIKKHSEYRYGFVCFNFALDDIKNWINNCRDAYDILEDQYEQINIRKAKKGDLISYHELNNFESEYERPCNGNALHFAVIKRTQGTLKSTIIDSKWGSDGVFQSSLNDVPDSYGNAIVIWRKEE